MARNSVLFLWPYLACHYLVVLPYRLFRTAGMPVGSVRLKPWYLQNGLMLDYHITLVRDVMEGVPSTSGLSPHMNRSLFDDQ